MEAISLSLLVSPLLVPEKVLLFSVSDLDNKEIVAKKEGKFLHCKCESGDILSQVEVIFFLPAVLLFASFLEYKYFSIQKGKYLCWFVYCHGRS